MDLVRAETTHDVADEVTSAAQREQMVTDLRERLATRRIQARTDDHERLVARRQSMRQQPREHQLTMLAWMDSVIDDTPTPDLRDLPAVYGPHSIAWPAITRRSGRCDNRFRTLSAWTVCVRPLPRPRPNETSNRALRPKTPATDQSPSMSMRSRRASRASARFAAARAVARSWFARARRRSATCRATAPLKRERSVFHASASRRERDNRRSTAPT